MSRRRARVSVVMASIAASAGLVGATGETRTLREGCDAGTTIFVDGGLRIFAVRFRDAGAWGSRLYACSGRRGRPAGVGLTYDDGGTASDRNPAFAYGGGRYLGRYHVTDGEGGPSASFDVTDLRARRTVVYENVPCCEGLPRFLVASNGALITAGDALRVHLPGRRARKVSAPGTDAREPALVGSTLYWTEYAGGEPAAARSTTLQHVGTARESAMLEPAYVRHRSTRCATARGRTIAASPNVRVIERERRGGSIRRVACRVAGGVRVRAGSPDAAAPRIVGDRWLLVLGPGRPATRLAVIDMRSGERVVRAVPADGARIVQATLLGDGSAAWLDDAGRVIAQRPHGQPVELAPRTDAAGALAGARRTVYWTSGGDARSASLAR